MNRKLMLTSAVVVVVLSAAAVPAGAQDRRDNGQKRGSARVTASQSAPRQNAAQQAVPRQAPRQAAPQVRENAPRSAESRQYAAPQSSPRAYGSPQHQSRAVPRSDARPSYQAPSYRNDDRRGYAQPRGGYGSPSARPYYSRPYVRPYNYVPYRPYYFSRPYYSFRPWLSIGFGLWTGYPVPYPYAYLGTYRPRVYGYYGNGSYGVSPDVSIYGGLSFDIQPADADLFVDGQYVGSVGTFSPNGEPLTLTPGQHQIAIQRDGFRAMEWDVTIQPGQVIPYRGAMER